MADISLPLLPPLPGDCDGDGDVDLDDYGACFEPCLRGPGQGVAGPCTESDFDGDDDVDLADFGVFQFSFSS
jgi:hypothetical protein